ncbi:MAG TPA: catalase [Urbifossiella sp.]|jgi:catalase|nr:catalase [Urbifossiella sp.]
MRVAASLAVAAAVGVAHAQPPAATPTPSPRLTQDGGRPVGNGMNSRTAGENGPVLLDDFHLIQKLARFDRERIPERVVHARGVGAHGEFVSYGDFSGYTRAKLFSAKDKKTPVFVRCSTVIHPGGSPEQLRDPRGFAVKFFTEEGNWDLVGNNLPVFFIRDALLFPDMVHGLKPSPITNQQDPNRFFDFFSHVPESTHMLTFLYSDQGTPANLRQMDGFGVHAFKWVNARGEVRYVKFNWRSLQGHKTYTAAEAADASAKNHSGHSADLYAAIEAGNFPAWELGVQIIPAADLDKFEFHPLDPTKVWTGVPETKVGKMTLNRVPANFFQFTEQAAFSPGMLVPGIEASEDRLLQGRLFSYADTQRYRLGANYLDLPVNRPAAPVSNVNQGGALNGNVTTSDVNYSPSVTTGGRRDDRTYEASKGPITGGVQQQPIRKTLDFKQAGELYRSLTPGQRENLIRNLAGDLGQVRNPVVKLRMLSHFYRADVEYGTRLAEAVGADVAEVRRVAEAPTAEAGR